MELQILLQDDIDGRATRALDEALSLSNLRDSVTRVYEEEIPGTLGTKEDIKSFIISLGASATVAVVAEILSGWTALPSSCGTKASITNPSSEPEQSLVIDPDNPPSKKEIEDLIQEVMSTSQEPPKQDSLEK